MLKFNQILVFQGYQLPKLVLILLLLSENTMNHNS